MLFYKPVLARDCFVVLKPKEGGKERERKREIYEYRYQDVFAEFKGKKYSLPSRKSKSNGSNCAFGSGGFLQPYQLMLESQGVILICPL